MTTIAGIYARISDDRAGAGLGVVRQEGDCRALAEKLGWAVGEVYTDNDISAYDRRRRRPSWTRMLSDLEAGRIGAVIAWHPDRMYRRMSDLLLLIDLCEKQSIPVATVTAGAINLGDPTGRAVAKTVAAWAEHESEHKAARARRKEREMAEAGRPHGGLRPFGYAADRVTVVPAEAAAVVDCARRVLAGESLRALANDLDSRGVPTVTGVPWSPTVLRMMLLRPRYAGLREHHGQTYPAAWPAILPTDVHLALTARMTDPARRTSGSARVNLLTGLIACDACREPMTVHYGGANRPITSQVSYYCQPCQMYGSRTGCDERVIELVLEALADPELRASLSGGEPEQDDEAVLVAGHARLEEIGREFGSASGPMAVVARAAISEVDARMQAARLRLASRGASRSALPDLQAMDRPAWDALPLPTRRALIAGFFPDLRLRRPTSPARTFDPNRIAID